MGVDELLQERADLVGNRNRNRNTNTNTNTNRNINGISNSRNSYPNHHHHTKDNYNHLNQHHPNDTFNHHHTFNRNIPTHQQLNRQQMHWTPPPPPPPRDHLMAPPHRSEDEEETRSLSPDLPGVTRRVNGVYISLIHNRPRGSSPRSRNMKRRLEENLSFPLHAAIEKRDSIDVIRKIIEQDGPNAVRERNTDGNLPIHRAIQVYHSYMDDDAAKANTLTLVQFLLDTYPESIKQVNAEGLFPLHLAARHFQKVDFFKGILRSYPAAVRGKDPDGFLPLHHAVQNQDISVAAVRLILKEFPEAVREPDFAGWLPLHHAASFTYSTGIIDLLMEHFPEGIRQRDASGSLPLHRAVQHSDSSQVIDMLIDYYPEAVRLKDASGCLPLHIAARHCAYRLIEIIKYLLPHYPEAAQKQNTVDQDLPLHIVARACGPNAENARDVLQQLLEAFPAGTHVRNAAGLLPLGIALREGCSMKVLQYFLQYDPDCGKYPDKAGMFPLHVTCLYNKRNGNGRDDYVAPFLAHQFPRIVSAKDDYGNLPLHLALKNKDRISGPTLQVLLQFYPEGIATKNADGYLPLHLAVLHHHNCSQLVQYLIHAFPGSVTVKHDWSGDLALHMLAAAAAAAAADGKGRCCATLRYLIKIDPKGLQERNKNGFLPVHLAAMNATVNHRQSSLEMIYICLRWNPSSLWQTY